MKPMEPQDFILQRLDEIASHQHEMATSVSRVEVSLSEMRSDLRGHAQLDLQMFSVQDTRIKDLHSMQTDIWKWLRGTMGSLIAGLGVLVAHLVGWIR